MIEPAVADRLAGVGHGTPMGNLLRRYWHPISALPELQQEPVLLGYRVPVDDTHTLNVSYYAIRPENGEPVDPTLRVEYDPLTYDQLGRVEGRDVGRQDEMAFVAQGLITDRTQWHPATSDKESPSSIGFCSRTSSESSAERIPSGSLENLRKTSR